MRKAAWSCDLLTDVVGFVVGRANFSLHTFDPDVGGTKIVYPNSSRYSYSMLCRNGDHLPLTCTSLDTDLDGTDPVFKSP